MRIPQGHRVNPRNPYYSKGTDGTCTLSESVSSVLGRFIERANGGNFMNTEPRQRFVAGRTWEPPIFKGGHLAHIPNPSVPLRALTWRVPLNHVQDTHGRSRRDRPVRDDAMPAPLPVVRPHKPKTRKEEFRRRAFGTPYRTFGTPPGGVGWARPAGKRSAGPVHVPAVRWKR